MNQVQIKVWWAGYLVGNENVLETQINQTINKWQRKLDSGETIVTSVEIQMRPTLLCIDVLSGKNLTQYNLKRG